MQREGIFREMQTRRFYEKLSKKRAREKAGFVRRARKPSRKKAAHKGKIAESLFRRFQVSLWRGDSFAAAFVLFFE